MNPLIHPELQPFVERAKQFPFPVCETVTEMRQAHSDLSSAPPRCLPSSISTGAAEFQAIIDFLQETL